ncbi:MAG: chemotaxis protein MotB [Alphaproteobacteria bacterium]|nr:MAG: chemotaxis protein MotB [Alphaproteobacteria bacterium]
MAKRGDNIRPIIKRRKIVAGDGHHGGAWKVAYADFVTAMMAFFLLMWLLNATTEEQRKGIADYFSPSLPISRISQGGDNLFEGKTQRADALMIEDGVGAREELRRDGPAMDPDSTEKKSVEARRFAEIENLLRGDSGESTVEDALLDHVVTRVTDEGLIVEIFDRDGPPLFAAGTAEPSAKLSALIDLMVEIAGLLANPVAIAVHTDALPFAGKGYDNFDLSTDRAQAVRRMMVARGLASDRIRRVTGKGASEPAVADPLAPRNRRVVITFLRERRDAR